MTVQSKAVLTVELSKNRCPFECRNKWSSLLTLGSHRAQWVQESNPRLHKLDTHCPANTIRYGAMPRAAASARRLASNVGRVTTSGADNIQSTLPGTWKEENSILHYLPATQIKMQSSIQLCTRANISIHIWNAAGSCLLLLLKLINTTRSLLPAVSFHDTAGVKCWFGWSIVSDWVLLRINLK